MQKENQTRVAMKTTIDIDHRVWKDWHSESDPDSAISHLNKLLEPHGVRLRKTSGPIDDWMGLEAESSPNAGEAQKVNPHDGWGSLAQETP